MGRYILKMMSSGSTVSSSRWLMFLAFFLVAFIFIDARHSNTLDPNTVELCKWILIICIGGKVGSSVLDKFNKKEGGDE